jgi:hypothetical protein
MASEPQSAAYMPMSQWRRRWIFGSIAVAIAALAIPLVTGFRGIEVSQRGESVIYRSSIWWMISFLVSGLAMFSMGIVIVTIPHVLSRLLGCVVLAGGLMVVAVAPTSLVHRLVVTSDGFEHTIGFWWQPQTTSVRFDELTSMTIVSYRDQDGLRQVRLECAHKDGRRITIPGSDVLRAGLARISVWATIRKVSVSTRNNDKR